MWPFIAVYHKIVDSNWLHCIYATGGMDISGGSVPAGPNLTGEKQRGINTNI